MESKWYREYAQVPSKMSKEADQYLSTLKFLQTLERVDLVDVKPLFAARPHDVVAIVVNEIVYDEPISYWIRRFK